MTYVAIDVDAMFNGAVLREHAAQAVADTIAQGFRFVWITNDTVDYVRKAERALGLDRKWQVLDRVRAESLVKAQDTVFAPGEVSVLIGCLPQPRMEVYMQALPCDNYVLFDGTRVLEWLTDPPPNQPVE